MLKLRIICLLFLISLLGVSNSVVGHAHHTGDFTGGVKAGEISGLVGVYNPNGGGLLASPAVYVSFDVNYRNSSLPGYHDVGIFGYAKTHRNIFPACGGSINLVSPANFGSGTATMVEGGNHLADPRFGYSFKHSNLIGAGPRPYSYLVSVRGNYTPTQSMCVGGGNVTHSIRFSN
ncbi:hypothetical protein ACEK07_32490 [Alcanivoracaceae bacterium MT1]